MINSTKMSEADNAPPPHSKAFALSYPASGVLLFTINKPATSNSISLLEHWEADAIFTWFDAEPSLRVAIITGAGDNAFCSGQDLKQQGSLDQNDLIRRAGLPRSGFAGLSLRVGKKPVIAAVNGLALGGGFEICLNCDIVIASPAAEFGLPEVLWGLYAGAGGIPRLTRLCGMQFTSEITLTGRRIPVAEAKEMKLVNKITASRESLLEDAVAMAIAICQASPDSVVVSRAAIREAWETGSVIRAGQLTAERYQSQLMTSDNVKIGLKAFSQKRKPQWVSSKL